MSFKLMSKGIVDGIIKREYGRLAGNNILGIPQLSIPLNWIDVPKETRSLAITCMDYDNYMEEGYAWLHWSVTNIPADMSELPEGCSVNIKDLDPMYNALRPYRSSESELRELVLELRKQYGAEKTADFVEEAMRVLKERKKLRGDR